MYKNKNIRLQFNWCAKEAISKTLNAKLVFEDDYVKTLNWLADLDGSLPAIRVSNCKLSKGQSGNDIKMELSLDIPIINSENGKDSQA